MIEERMNVSDENSRYHAFHLSEHFLRYQTIAALCKGKKVLDFSCGEGYGSYLLARNGALSVTGVDISETAICNAQSLFNQQNIRFVRTSAESIEDTLKGENFDVIVSLETIEHVTSPVAMLRAIKSLVKKDGIIVMSCPNDYAHPGISNPYHLKKYSYDEFKDTTESILGPASNTYIGTPLHGHAILNSEHAAALGENALSILQTAASSGINWISPSQREIYPDRNTCSYYLLVWNGALETPSTCSSYQSLYGAIDPWHQIDALTSEIRRLSAFESSAASIQDQLKIQQDENLRIGTALALARESQSQLEQSHRVLQEENFRLGVALANARNLAAEVCSTALSVPLTKWEKRRKKWANSVKKRLPHRR